MFAEEFGLPSRRALLGVIAAFFILSGIVYGRAVIQSEFVRWDDGMLVYENPAIREITPASVTRIFTMYDPELYIPLTFLSYQIDYQIGGIQPLQYHLTSFLFHTLNGLLVAGFVTLLLKKKWLGLFCGLAFLLHPLHTEAIMWVSGRKDLLSTFFFLLTLIQWLRWQDYPERRRYLFAIAFFVLALLSKVMAITLPVILLLIDWREQRAFTWEMVKEKIPFFALSVIFGLIGIGGKTQVVASSSWAEKILMSGMSSTFYLQKILWPDFFSLLYPYHKAIVITSPDFFIPIIVWSLIALLLLFTYRKTRDIAFGIAFFVVTVAPTFLNFTKGGDLDIYFASDRYSYVPSIGIFIAVTVLANLIWKKALAGGAQGEAMPRPYKNSIRNAPLIVAAVIIITLGYLSYRQSQVWRTTYTLLMNVLQYYPESHVAHNNIANAWRLEGRLDDAIGEFEKALAIKPHPKIYANLGAVYRKQGKITEALYAYNKALALPGIHREAYMGRALVWLTQRDFVKAEADLHSALQEDPTYLEAHTNLGATYATEGKYNDAVKEYRIAITLNPFFPDAHYNLAVALAQLNQTDEAMNEYELTIRQAPSYIPARINLALLLYKSGDQDGAKAQFEDVLKIDPNNASAKKALQQLGS